MIFYLIVAVNAGILAKNVRNITIVKTGINSGNNTQEAPHLPRSAWYSVVVEEMQLQLPYFWNKKKYTCTCSRKKIHLKWCGGLE